MTYFPLDFSPLVCDKYYKLIYKRWMSNSKDIFPTSDITIGKESQRKIAYFGKANKLGWSKN
jgi:hypothetical protein